MNEQNHEEQGLSLGDLLFLVKKDILLIIVLVMAFTIAGGIYGFGFKSTTYTATATGIVMAESNSNSQNGYQDYLYSNYLINTYKDFLISEPVLEKASTKTSLSKDEIKKSVTIDTTPNSLLIKITAKSGNSEDAKLIADELLNSAIEVSKTKKNDGTYKYDVLAEKLVDMEYSSEPIGSRGAGLVIAISFIVGCIVAFLIILVKFLLDDTFTSKDSFEKMFNINVLAMLPEITIEGGTE